ncbi:hypothetical protein KIPB_016869, partial [Kipferlia bialata]|eukprot:g16806.t1
MWTIRELNPGPRA